MEQTAELWKRYIEHDDRAARETLIVHYAKMVKYVAGRLALRLPAGLDQDDLIGYGTIGLVEAVDHFDPSRGVKFESYARARIQGKMLDSLRAQDLLPRSARRHVRALEKAIADLSQQYGRTPSDEEIAAHLEISIDTYYRWLADSNSVVISLEQPITSGDGEPQTLYDAIEDKSVDAPQESLDNKEMKSRLLAAVKSLSEREQLLISLYYIEELTMKEIGQVLGVSESRVSQMHAKTILTLLGQMKEGEPSPVVTYSVPARFAASNQQSLLQQAYRPRMV